MQTTRKQILAAALAVVLIAAGALFLIAPVWQPQRPAAAYLPVTAAQTPAPEPELIDINTATAARALARGRPQHWWHTAQSTVPLHRWPMQLQSGAYLYA